MKKSFIITLSLSILVMLGSFGVGIENAFATVCNQLVEVEDKDQSFIYIQDITIAARPDMGIIIRCVTDVSGECILEGLLEHTSYTIIVEQNSIPAEYECEYISTDCEADIIACESQLTFELNKIATVEPTPAPIFQADNLVDLTSEGSDRNNDCVDDCPKVPCKSSCKSAGDCNCRTVGEGEGATTVCDPNYKCSGCSGPNPCPKNKINSVFNSLDDHYKNVEDDYNKILNSLEQIRDIDAPSIKDSYKKINSIIPINLTTTDKLKPEPTPEPQQQCDWYKSCPQDWAETETTGFTPAPPDTADDILLGQVWTINHAGHGAKCCDENQENCKPIGRNEGGTKCCKQFYSDSVDHEIIYTGGGNVYYMQYNCLDRLYKWCCVPKNSSIALKGYYVDQKNQEIFDKLNYCRSKMNLCFSRLHEYEVIEKEEVVREILIPCQIGKYEYLTGAENCYGFDMEHLDRAENLLCYHHMGEISLDEIAEEEPEPEEPEEADVILGQIWLDIHKYTYMTFCRDKNKENPSNLGYVDVPNKCCKKHYENSTETKLIETIRQPDANHYWEKYDCLGY